jgi:hypothetical protein
MKKSTVVQIITTGAAVVLAAVLTLTGCGKKSDGSEAVSGSPAVSESVADGSTAYPPAERTHRSPIRIFRLRSALSWAITRG